MKKFHLWGLLMALLFTATAANAQRYTLSGTIKDSADGEDLFGATVWVGAISNGTTSNAYGFYSLTLPKGTYQVTYSFIGYQEIVKEVVLDGDVQLNISLSFEETQLDAIVVSEEAADKNVMSTEMSVNTIPIQQVKELPALFGEPDLIKTVQMQPGVLTAGEGTSAFFVRGGSADQNLILIDEAPIYDPSHLFGLFSVFNADVLRSSKLYKGGIPSQYGGRLSSILDVRTKDGNLNEFAGAGSIGLLASKGMIEGPIIPGEASFLLSGRRSYLDIFSPFAEALQDNKIAFYDINAKLSWRPSDKNRHFLAYYRGRDNFSFGEDFGFGWGNQTLTYRWNHLLSNKVFGNFTVIGSIFDYKLELLDPESGFSWTSDIQELTIKEDLEWDPNPSNSVYFGFQLGYRRYQPGSIVETGSNGNFNDVKLQSLYGLDNALYIGNRQKISSRLSLDYGLRLGVFMSIGDGTYREYLDVRDRDNIIVTDSTTYDNFEVIQTWINPQPRLGLRFALNGSSSIKASYQRMVQNAHVISSGTVPLPFNTWNPTGPYLEPQISDQVAGGYFRNFRDNSYEFSAEAYYKKSNNITEFADNAQIFFNTDLATEFRQGEAESYGLELFLNKTKGNLTGFVGYTLSRTEYTIPDANDGRPYLANFNRAHAFNASATFALNDKWTFGASFVYYTGRPITLPSNKYRAPAFGDFSNGASDYQANEYTDRNQYTLPDFHRLDISVNKYSDKKLFNFFEQSWNVSVYNLYGRRNPFTVFAAPVEDENGDRVGNQSEFRMIWLFGMLPSFTYSLKF